MHSEYDTLDDVEVFGNLIEMYNFVMVGARGLE